MTPDDIRELFAAFGPVELRRLFGGAGLYADRVMFALVARGVIYLKTDANNTPAFEREGLEPFTYATKTGRRGVMSYRRMPDRLYDDPEELAVWARAALAAASASGAGRQPAKARRKPTGARRTRP